MPSYDREYLKTMVIETINQKSAEVIAQGKRSFYRQIEMGLTDAYATTSQNMVKNLELNDANEGISSFLEKPPVFTTAL